MFRWLRRWVGEETASKTTKISDAPPIARSTDYWIQVRGSSLAQGDYLPGCLVPEFHPDFGSGRGEEMVKVAKQDLIIVTQSCDLENQKVAFAALCPIYGLSKFEEINPHFR